ncbi:MAG: helix-turn-helix domain-containing protein [Treponema sp.]|jgi:predicted transcriptional regulator|nr:helix-turn-helix domain-containing protein [Treponema sp.]
MKKRITLEMSRSEETAEFFKALSSPVRIKLLATILKKPLKNITELAEEFSLPLSTAAFHVKTLEKAGLIFVQEKPGLRGSQKLCTIQAEDVYLKFFNRDELVKRALREITCGMPLGNYFDCSVVKPCGIASHRSFISTVDSENAFFSPSRIHAQLLWFSSGSVEYRFPNHNFKSPRLLELAFSFEACSEAPGYNNDWPSDITVWINGEEVSRFRSAGDYGGVRGIYNPAWWPDDSTQYGDLHRLEINDQGCFSDGRKTSDLDLERLQVTRGDYISFRIGVKEDAEYVGGINLFGERFGNYRQNIELVAKLER